jgi:fructokinase
MARIGEHGFGRILRDTATTERVDLSATPNAPEPTTLAVVSLDEPGQAAYDFYVNGTSDWQWTLSELRGLPEATNVIHFGSIASWTPPGDEIIDQVVGEARARGRVLIGYDPNIRPSVLGSAAKGRQLVERSVRRAHLVKASREDLEWLYPSQAADEVAAHWLELGPDLVVVTDGADGASAYRPGASPVRQPGRPVKVVDTIGAGDAFTAGLLTGLLRRDLRTPDHVAALDDGALHDVLAEAVLVSSLTCERAGADPPRLAAASANGRVLQPDDFVAS